MPRLERTPKLALRSPRTPSGFFISAAAIQKPERKVTVFAGAAKPSTAFLTRSIPMAQAARRPCTHPGCGALTDTGRCEKHPRLAEKREHEQRRGNRHE